MVALIKSRGDRASPGLGDERGISIPRLAAVLSLSLSLRFPLSRCGSPSLSRFNCPLVQVPTVAGATATRRLAPRCLGSSALAARGEGGELSLPRLSLPASLSLPPRLGSQAGCAVSGPAGLPPFTDCPNCPDSSAHSLSGGGRGQVRAGTETATGLLKSVTANLGGRRELPVTRIVDGLMENKAGGEAEDFAYWDPNLHDDAGARPKEARKPVREALVFVVGGGNYVEYGDLQEYARRANR
jgi:hypothetical protein